MQYNKLCDAIWSDKLVRLVWPSGTLPPCLSIFWVIKNYGNFGPFGDFSTRHLTPKALERGKALQIERGHRNIRTGVDKFFCQCWNSVGWCSEQSWCHSSVTFGNIHIYKNKWIWLCSSKNLFLKIDSRQICLQKRVCQILGQVHCRVNILSEYGWPRCILFPAEIPYQAKSKGSYHSHHKASHHEASSTLNTCEACCCLPHCVWSQAEKSTL